MALQDHIIQFEGGDDIEKEWKEQADRAWEILCRTGSVCLTDINKSGQLDIKEILKKDPAAFTRAHCDYNSCDDIPYDKFVKSIMADKK